MAGIYTPTEGVVSIGGCDTKELCRNSIYKNISGVFQKFQKYQMTLRENVVISDLNNVIDDDSIKNTLRKADVNYDSATFIDGLDTMLSREFDGIDLSGGQWQRIAIARGLNRKHKIIVLDEPTAAIDPLEETNLYKKFAEISKGITSILVTHRLGSARIADKIIVMDEGSIVEFGTHEELLNNHGKYYDMFQAQAKWYI